MLVRILAKKMPIIFFTCVGPSLFSSTFTGQTYSNLVLEPIIKICRDAQNVITIWQKYRELYMKM
jgi:hypothetical protein